MTTVPAFRRSTWLALSFAALSSACGRTGRSPAPAPVSAPSSVSAAPAPSAADARGLPDRLSDSAFWALQARISEPGGYFRIEDNYTSNEMEVGQVYTMLRDTRVQGDVYMGVGPEQNFTYIAAIRPRMAFIVDIRRQAVMQHLMFKAIFEMANDRADFISLLFGKPRPPVGPGDTTIQRLWELYRPVQSDSALANRTYQRMVERLTKTHGFTFTADESEKLKAVFDAFFFYGPSIATRGYSGGRGGDFAQLTGFATDSSGQPRSFLSSEENFRYVKSLHDRNLIVPVSGDFAGPKAIREIGRYLRAHDATVRAFYLSNVEQYLFMPPDRAPLFYDNVAALPTDSASVFIRPYSMRRFGFGAAAGPGQTLPLCPIQGFLMAVRAGRVQGNSDALACPR